MTAGVLASRTRAPRETTIWLGLLLAAVAGLLVLLAAATVRVPRASPS
jgi:hypothetical protein